MSLVSAPTDIILPPRRSPLTSDDGSQHYGDEHYEKENAADCEPGRATEVEHKNLPAASRVVNVNVVSSGSGFDERVVTLDVRGLGAYVAVPIHVSTRRIGFRALSRVP